MEGCRRLSFCACANHFPDSLSNRDARFQGRACAGCGWTGTGRRRRRGQRWRCWAATSVRSAEANRRRSSGCRRASEDHASSKTDRASGDHHACCARSCYGAADNDWSSGSGRRQCGHTGRWARKRRRSRIRSWARQRERRWTRNWWRTGGQLSADADAILFASAPRACESQGIPSHRLVRCRRERERKTSRIQSVTR